MKIFQKIDITCLHLAENLEDKGIVMDLLIPACFLGVWFCLFVAGFYIQIISDFRATESVNLERNKKGHPEEAAQHDADVATFSISSKSVQVPLDTTQPPCTELTPLFFKQSINSLPHL